MKKRLFTAILLLTFLQYLVFAQSSQNWIFLTYTRELSNKYDFLLDAQIRTENPVKNISAILLRSAVSYKINEKKSIALGYAFKKDWIIESNTTKSISENRAYEQYQYDFKWNKMEWTLRTRLEQRFVEEGYTKFSVRGRAFVSILYPLTAGKDFSKGLFAGLQNEIFINLLKKNNVNGHFFDQNRPYLSLGYRFNRKMEASVDYGLMLTQDFTERELNNLFRLSITIDM